MAGKGRYKWPSGQVYEGEWSANQRHGYGRTTHANGVMTEGDWIEGVLSGKGKLVDPSGLHQFEVRPARIFLVPSRVCRRLSFAKAMSQQRAWADRSSWTRLQNRSRGRGL